MTIFELQKNLNAFDIRQAVKETLEETAHEITELQRGQMFIGRRADGTEILPTYKDITIEIKQEKGQPYDRVTLRDTGDFWEGIFVTIQDKTFELYSTDWKTEKLIKKYGENIFGLSSESLNEEFTPLYFFPKLKEKIESATQLTFTNV